MIPFLLTTWGRWVLDHALRAAGGPGRLAVIVAGAIGLLVFFANAYPTAGAGLEGARDAARESNVAATWLLVIVLAAGVVVAAAWAVYRIRCRPAEDQAIAEAAHATQVALALEDAARRQAANNRRAAAGAQRVGGPLRVEARRLPALEPATRRQLR